MSYQFIVFFAAWLTSACENTEAFKNKFSSGKVALPHASSGENHQSNEEEADHEGHSESSAEASHTEGHEGPSHESMAKSRHGHEPICNDESASWVLYDKEEGTLLYCNSGEWEELPKHSFKEKAHHHKKTHDKHRKSPRHNKYQRFDRVRTSKHDTSKMKEESRTPASSNTSFYCRPSPQGKESFLCTRNLPKGEEADKNEPKENRKEGEANEPSEHEKH